MAAGLAFLGGAHFPVMLLSPTTPAYPERDAMKLEIDEQLLTLECSGCGQKIEEPIGRLRTNPNLICPACSATIDINADKLNEGIKSVEKQLDALRASLDKLFK
jgi:hypothetical protein